MADLDVAAQRRLGPGPEGDVARSDAVARPRFLVPPSEVELRAMQQKRQLGQQGPEAGRIGQAGARGRAGNPGRAAAPATAPAWAGPGGPIPAAAASAAAPISTPQASLERLIVRAPEEASPF